MAKALDLVDGIKPEAVLADRAYDADRLTDTIWYAGAEPVILPRRYRKHQHAYNKALYKERNVIERFTCSLGPMAFTGSLNKLKQFRHVATRCNKLLTNFMGFIKTTAIAIWLR